MHLRLSLLLCTMVLGMAMLSGQAAGMANQSCPSVLEPYFVLASTDSSSLSLELGTQVTILDSQACVQGVRVWLTSPSTSNGVATVSIWSPTGSLLFRSSSGQQQASGSYAWDFYSSSCVVGSSFTVSFSTTNTLLGYAAPISLPRSNSGFSVTASVFSDGLGQFPVNQASLSHVHMVEPLVCSSPATPPSSSCPSALNSITFLNTDPNSLYQELGTTGQILATSPTACMSGIRIYLSVSSSTPGAVVSLWNGAGVLQWQSSNGSLVTPGGQIYEYLMPSCSRVVPLSTFTVSFHTVNSNTYGYAGDGGSYTPTPYFQITSSVAASSINMFPSGASGHYHMIEPIICGGTQASCPLNTDCNSCAKTSGCQWCLDSSTCTITNSTCQSYIQNPSFCPAPACSTYASCTTCTSASSSSCTWCLDSNSCVTRSTTCPDRISSPSFCPTSLLEFFEEPSKK